MIKPADENSPFAGVKFDGTLKNEGVTVGFARIVSQEDYNRGYQEGRKEAEKTLRDEIAMRAMQGIISNAKTMQEITRHVAEDKFFRAISRLAYDYADAMLKVRQGDE